MDGLMTPDSNQKDITCTAWKLSKYGFFFGPFSVRIRENMDKKISVFGHFSRSDEVWLSQVVMLMSKLPSSFQYSAFLYVGFMKYGDKYETKIFLVKKQVIWIWNQHIILQSWQKYSVTLYGILWAKLKLNFIIATRNFVRLAAQVAEHFKTLDLCWFENRKNV